VDQDGQVGHFTSAGMRTLPKSVKKDRDATELIAKYFFEQAPVTGKWSPGAGVEKDCGGWEKQGLERYVRDFALMATKGLFSFDAELRGEGRYYLVAIPAHPLRVDDLPGNIKEILSRTTVSLPLKDCAYINGATTESW
jgi:hypothetical protein